MECPVCGSLKAKSHQKRSYRDIPFGPPAVFNATIITCPDCGSEIDETSDILVKEAVKSSTRKSIKPMLEYLKILGHTYTGMERALDLPIGTMQKWERGEDLNPESVTLLRLIRTIPELINTADNL